MTSRVGLVFLFLIVTTASGQSPKQETVSAKQVHDRMLSAYRSCKSYMDKGEVKEVRSNATPIVKKPFTTAFIRPSRFRFEFTEDSNQRAQNYVIWRDGVSIRSWWSIQPGVRYYETLGEAVNRATGVSSMSAVVVPSMLFQDLGDTGRIQSLTELSLVREEKVNGKAAYRIEGKDWANMYLTIWVDKQTFLLVKFFERRENVEITIRYEPKIDPDIPPGKLAFKH